MTLAGFPWAVGAIIAVAYFFDFLNGMHDAANSIATVVSTKVLSPRAAVIWAAVFNFAAAFGLGVSVASTIGKGLVDPHVMDNVVIAAALIGAAFWNWLTIYLGIPVSSSHSLIGGLVGAAVAKAGWACLLPKLLIVTVAFIVLSPLIGLVFSLALMTAVSWIFRRSSPRHVDNVFRVGQLASAALLSFSHGANDSQKTMGIISILLFANGLLGPTFYVPYWVVLSCCAMMGLGTAAGGWKVVKTLGHGVTKLKPVGGFCAETGAGACLLVCSLFGIPVSTTHVVTGSIIGVGSTQRLSAVRWGVAGRIVWAWVLTIPCAAAVSSLLYLAVRLI